MRVRGTQVLAQGGFRRDQLGGLGSGVGSWGNRARFSKKPTRLIHDFSFQHHTYTLCYITYTSHLQLRHASSFPSHNLEFSSSFPRSFSFPSLPPVFLSAEHVATMFRPVLRNLPRTTAAIRPAAVRTFASASGPTFNWEDPLNSKNLFTEEELAIGETAERYCQERMLPRVLRMLRTCAREPVCC